ncbi:MAG: xanthine dehydrogenase family protein subunit M [Nitrospinota bacterium]|jgi:carbon-monoxide dehydrogenase medium subunit|nr:xanthine dehydrogenase family protein subunit M [Nitrospinota bacterium]MDP6483410.1 xanthine dehydrogenase family protein subunit M [Nitrospinota bacterium]MDP7384412.1 xanthine dehydrogenase family protein subunit M [Nitrospinota bacterium]
MWRQFEYHEPATVEETCDLLARHGDESLILAGGTALLKLMKLRIARPAVLLNVKKIPGLDYIENSNGGALRIGGLAVYRNLARGDHGREYLAHVASDVGSVQVRNIATVAGALCLAEPSSDIGPVLMTLDAEVELTSKSGKRAVPINDFFQDAFETRREPEEMMTEIRVPPLPEGAGWDYQKFCLRRGFDIAVVGVAAVVERDGDTVRSARIAVGAARPTPFRHPETEALLSGRTFSEDLCRAAAEKVTDGLDGITDVRASGKYRVHLTRVLVRRALEAAFQRASG